MPEYSVLGKRIPRADALGKVTGSARYSADIILHGMLHGKVLRSPYARANIIHLDTSKAEALAGVRAVITAEDVPGWKSKNKDELHNPMLCCLARDRVFFAGQPVAAVAAINTQIAEEALKLIHIEYEVLTPVIDVLEAMQPASQLVHPDSRTENLPDSPLSNIFMYARNGCGDIEAGFKAADLVLENTFRTHRVHQGYLEPRAAIASVEPSGRVTVWSDNQSIFGVREYVAEFLNLPLNKVRTMPVEVGGAFGGKEPQVLSPLCALLSLKTGRPVRMIMTRAETFTATRPAPDAVIRVKLGARNDGKLTAASASMIYDYGALHGVHGMHEVPFATFTGLSLYKIPNVLIQSHSVYTNKAPSGPYRSPTAPQAAFAVESMMDMMAEALQIDPLEFRLRNAASEGDTLLMTGQPYARIGFKETLEKMQAYLSQHGKPEGENRGRGIGCGFWAPNSGNAGANINLNADGSVIVTVGSVDISGAHTSLAQVAAEELGIPVEEVTVTLSDTDTAPYSIPSVGSMITRSAGAAVRKACQHLKQQLCIRAAEQLEVAADEVEYVRGILQVHDQSEKSISIAELGWHSINLWGSSSISGHAVVGMQEPAPTFVVQAADVEVDRETGKVKVISFATALDTGVAINPTLIEGQIQGAAAQGIGWAFFEGYNYENGTMQNPTFLDYRMPTATDVPFVDALLVEVRSNTEPFGIRGVGEPPFVACLGTLANAVYSATGVRIKELPMTPEVILKEIKKQENQF